MQLPPTAADLTHALRKSGVLDRGSVRDVVLTSDRTTIVSRVMRLRLGYDGPAANAPAGLILKSGLADRITPLWNGGRQEAEFYRSVAPGLAAFVVPRCFGAEWDEDAKAAYLLLEDLTDSHSVPTQWPLPPSRGQCETILSAAARFHAAWWDDPRLGVSVGRWLEADGVDLYLQALREKYAQFADRLNDALAPERRDLFERFLDAVPRLLLRIRSRRNVTVIHGDAHVWNFFLRRDGRDDVRMFDWDSWRLGIATTDLAYMMAVHWYPGRRRQMERSLLDHYHAVLVEYGVSGYDRRALEDDYRFSVLAQIMTPVWQLSGNIPPVIWWNNLERVLLAVDDLGCRDLLA
jgi:hypothetical protein